MVKLNNFSVSIKSNYVNEFSKNGSNYVGLEHESVYSIILSNSRNSECDASISIDGEKVGVFRVSPFSNIEIKRPSKVDKKFVFVNEKSSEAKDAGMSVGNSKNGLVSVVFTPAKIHYLSVSSFDDCDDCADDFGSYSLPASFPRTNSYGLEKSYGGSLSRNINSTNFQSGGTVLGSQSNQQFHNVSPITDIDTENITTIHIRLVHDTQKSKYSSLSSISSFSTPVPCPVILVPRIRESVLDSVNNF